MKNKNINREIKFRAWEKHEFGGGRMIEPCLNFMLDSFGYPYWQFGFDQPKPCNDFVVMQFTGLKDKNRKEIYEGDILKTIMKPEMIDVLWQVVWTKNEDGNMWGWMCKTENGMYVLDDGLQKTCKIIGNIYENPELLTPPPPQ